MNDYCDICGREMDMSGEPDESGSEVCDDCMRPRWRERVRAFLNAFGGVMDEPGRTFALTIIGLIWLCMAGLAWYLESVLLAGIGVAVALVFALLVVLLERHGRAVRRWRR